MVAAEKRPEPATVELPSEQESILRIPSLYGITMFAVLAAIFIVALAPRLDTDFWWHLKVGQYIANHHSVPSHDYMSYTFKGHAWTDHEWLAELVLFGLYSLAGLWGPIVFFAGVICASFALVYANMVQRKINRVLALFVLSAAFIASSASWGPRIQMMTLLFLAIYGLVLCHFEMTRNRHLLLILPAAMLIWANIHGGFVLGLVLVGITLVGEWLNKISRQENAYTADDLKVLMYAFLGTCAITIVNPNTYRQLTYPLTFILPNAYTNLIEESASPNFHLPVFMVFEIMLLALIIAFFFQRPKVNWTHLLLIVAFTHLAFSQSRSVPLWSIVISPLLAHYLRELRPIGLSHRRRLPAGGIKSVINVAILSLIVATYLLEATHFVNATTLRTAETDNYPRGAIAYMRSHHLPPDVFVSYSWGGYLLWNLFPQYRDYMDSRADTLYSSAILNGYLDIYAARPEWKTRLNQYHVQDVLIEDSAPLSQVLALDGNWRLVYHDSLSVLYTRR
jgi:hypothetical protein